MFPYNPRLVSVHTRLNGGPFFPQCLQSHFNEEQRVIFKTRSDVSTDSMMKFFLQQGGPLKNLIHLFLLRPPPRQTSEATVGQLSKSLQTPGLNISTAVSSQSRRYLKVSIKLPTSVTGGLAAGSKVRRNHYRRTFSTRLSRAGTDDAGSLVGQQEGRKKTSVKVCGNLMGLCSFQLSLSPPPPNPPPHHPANTHYTHHLEIPAVITNQHHPISSIDCISITQL